MPQVERQLIASDEILGELLQRDERREDALDFRRGDEREQPRRVPPECFVNADEGAPARCDGLGWAPPKALSGKDKGGVHHSVQRGARLRGYWWATGATAASV